MLLTADVYYRLLCFPDCNLFSYHDFDTMVKAYLRYKLDQTLGVVSTTGEGSVLAVDNTSNLVFTAALESVQVWNLKLGETVAILREGNDFPQVTILAKSKDGQKLAVGYSNGAIKLWQLESKKLLYVFTAHNTAITALQFNSDSSLLASGSKDSSIIVWDVISGLGKYRLKSHKDSITELKFIAKNNQLLSSSKDTTLKVWDLTTQHCIQTIVDHYSEVWSFDVDDRETRLVTGAADGKLRIFEVVDLVWSPQDDIVNVVVPRNEVIDTKIPKERIIRVRYGYVQNSEVVAVQFSGNRIQIYKKRTEKEIELRKKRLQKKQQRQGGDVELSPGEFRHLLTFACSSKVSSFAFTSQRGIVVALAANAIESYEFVQQGKSQLCHLRSAISLPGHRSPIRSLSVSYDDSMVLSVSNGLTKVWNVATGKCIRSISSGYGLCAMFVPGNRHAIIGTKDGSLELFDLQAAELLQKIDAHRGSVWSLNLSPTKRGFVSGASDGQVIFWDFELVQTEDSPLRKLQLTMNRSMTMDHEVLGVSISPNNRLFAVSLLDNTIKVFYQDSFDFFLSLYGHKLPVMSIDISSDSTLLVSGSADKNVKIWGLDFGDCHKSLFAHDGSVMQVKFVKDTHYFFSAGKDGLVKYWDADRFEQIMLLEVDCCFFCEAHESNRHM